MQLPCFSPSSRGMWVHACVCVIYVCVCVFAFFSSKTRGGDSDTCEMLWIVPRMRTCACMYMYVYVCLCRDCSKRMLIWRCMHACMHVCKHASVHVQEVIKESSSSMTVTMTLTVTVTVHFCVVFIPFNFVRMLLQSRCMSIHLCLCVRMFVCICGYWRSALCMYVCVCVCIYIYIHIYIYTHTHFHAFLADCQYGSVLDALKNAFKRLLQVECAFLKEEENEYNTFVLVDNNVCILTNHAGAYKFFNTCMYVSARSWKLCSCTCERDLLYIRGWQ